MNAHRVAVIVGNGLSIDFVQWRNVGAQWDPSGPLAWSLSTPGNSKTPLLDSLPRFRDRVDESRLAQPGCSDFGIFEEIVRGLPSGSFTTGGNWEDGLLATETRAFLGLAYAQFQLAVTPPSLSFSNWPWYQYLASLGSSLIGAMSFNYDLVFERVIEHAGYPVRGFAITNDPDRGIWVGKPHGSIDYEMSPSSISLPPVSYPSEMVVFANDTSIVRLRHDQLSQPRTQVEVVPPLAASEIRDFQWVDPAFREFARVGPTLDRLVIIGHSYGPVDRQELDELLSYLASGTEVVIANPDPPPELEKAVMARGLKPATWLHGPPSP
jgi:hypothetical protein